MAMQDAFGPVFACEWLRASRRWQLYAARAAFVGVILGGLLVLWESLARRPDGMDLREIAAFGRSVSWTVAFVELTLLLLAAPAATAGSICLDKARGSLIQVLGKLAVGLIPVVGLVFCAFPVQMLASLLGGSDPAALFGTLQVALGSAVLGCTLAFALSVWGRKVHEVLSATYLVIVLWVVILPFLGSAARIAGWSTLGWWGEALYLLEWVTPYALIQPLYNETAAARLGRTSLFLGACLGLSALLTLATILRIRPVTLNSRGEAAPTEGRWARLGRLRLPSPLPSPSLDANPVLWREWSRMRPSRWMRVTWAAYAACALGGTALALMDVVAGVGGVGEIAVFTNMLLIVVGLLLLSVRAATSLSEERIRGSLDVLLTTPMTTSEILAGKWWGTFRIVPGLAFLPGLIVGVGCLKSGNWAHGAGLVALIHAYGAAVTSAGLALAVWIPRQGRALAACVGLYAVACVGWFVVAIALLGNDTAAPIVLIGSPLWGAICGTVPAIGQHLGPAPFDELVPLGLAVWSLFYFVAAIGLFAAACLTFDRCLGRAPGRSVHEPEGPPLLALFPSFRREPTAAILEEARP